MNGKGVNFLKLKGIKVHLGLLAFESKALNRGYFRWINKGLPFVYAKIAQSLDGYIAKNRDEQIWITGEESKVHTHSLRSSVDAILVGRGTVIADNPKLTVRRVDGVSPIRVVLDANRKLPLDINLFNDNVSQTIVFCSNKRFNDSQTSFCRYYAVDETDGKLSILEVLKKLGELGVTSILVEGGEEVLSTFNKMNLIDILFLYTSKYKMDGGKLKNPISINSGWNQQQTEFLGSDKLHVFAKETECLQV